MPPVCSQCGLVCLNDIHLRTHLMGCKKVDASTVQAAEILMEMGKGTNRRIRETPYSRKGRIQRAIAGTEDVSEIKKTGAYEIQMLMVWLLQQGMSGMIDQELATLLSSISLACKQIATLVQRAAISNLTGDQGKDQKKLYVIANEDFSNCVKSRSIITSKEEDMPLSVRESDSGTYVMSFYPLDGSESSNIVSTGSIFGIYSRIADDAKLHSSFQRSLVNVCQPKRNLVAAGYCLYSSSITFVLAIGTGVFAFTLDPVHGEFVLTQQKIQIPKAGNFYTFDEENYRLWENKLKKYIHDLKVAGPEGKPYSARYTGSLVGNFHVILQNGGISGYPLDKKSRNGKSLCLHVPH